MPLLECRASVWWRVAPSTAEQSVDPCSCLLKSLIKHPCRSVWETAVYCVWSGQKRSLRDVTRSRSSRTRHLRAGRHIYCKLHWFNRTSLNAHHSAPTPGISIWTTAFPQCIQVSSTFSRLCSDGALRHLDLPSIRLDAGRSIRRRQAPLAPREGTCSRKRHTRTLVNFGLAAMNAA